MENSSESGCSDFTKCYEILKLMIDSQATGEQEKYFKEHIESCIHCFKQYKLERELKTMIRHQADRQTVPSDLIDTIRTAILPTP
ncbi:MAG: hypothetical protein WBA74_16255 [Cyclobacteriaceae bacterium]